MRIVQNFDQKLQLLLSQLLEKPGGTIRAKHFIRAHQQNPPFEKIDDEKWATIFKFYLNNKLREWYFHESNDKIQPFC